MYSSTYIRYANDSSLALSLLHCIFPLYFIGDVCMRTRRLWLLLSTSCYNFFLLPNLHIIDINRILLFFIYAVDSALYVYIVHPEHQRTIHIHFTRKHSTHKHPCDLTHNMCVSVHLVSNENNIINNNKTVTFRISLGKNGLLKMKKMREKKHEVCWFWLQTIFKCCRLNECTISFVASCKFSAIE